jgi:hypothetical protein
MKVMVVVVYEGGGAWGRCRTCRGASAPRGAARCAPPLASVVPLSGRRACCHRQLHGWWRVPCACYSRLHPYPAAIAATRGTLTPFLSWAGVRFTEENAQAPIRRASHHFQTTRIHLRHTPSIITHYSPHTPHIQHSRSALSPQSPHRAAAASPSSLALPRGTISAWQPICLIAWASCAGGAGARGRAARSTAGCSPPTRASSAAGPRQRAAREQPRVAAGGSHGHSHSG